MATYEEQYAVRRLEDMIKAVAGCLSPETLALVIDDIDANTPYPAPEDLALFANRMATQRATLTD